MFDPHAELMAFLRDNNVPEWVTGRLGGTQRLDEWAEDYLRLANEAMAEEDYEDAEAARAVREMMGERPNQIAFSAKKIKELLG